MAAEANRIHAAEGRAVGYAHAAISDGEVGGEAGFGEGEFGGANGQLGDPSHRAGVLAWPVGWHHEIRDRGAEPGVHVLEHIPLRYADDGVTAGVQIGRNRRPVAAEGGDAAHACDDDAVAHTRPPFTPMT